MSGDALFPSTMWGILQKELGHRTVVTPSVSYMAFTRMPQSHCHETTALESASRTICRTEKDKATTTNNRSKREWHGFLRLYSRDSR